MARRALKRTRHARAAAGGWLAGRVGAWREGPKLRFRTQLADARTVLALPLTANAANRNRQP